MNSCLINLGVTPTIKKVLSTDEKKQFPKKIYRIYHQDINDQIIGLYNNKNVSLSSRTKTDEEIVHHCNTCMFVVLSKHCFKISKHWSLDPFLFLSRQQLSVIYKTNSICKYLGSVENFQNNS